MLLTDLPFPVTIVARDGWTGHFKNAEEVRAWNPVAIRKYTRVRFIVADASGLLWNLVQLVSAEKRQFLDRFRFQPRALETVVHLEAIEDQPLQLFQERLRQALDLDCDVMTQFSSKEKILKLIDSAESVQVLAINLHKIRAIQ